MRARALALLAVVLMLLGLSAPAQASSYGRNYSASKSVIYTRHCLDYSSSSCALVIVHPGSAFPRNTAYAMPGTGWVMCPFADPQSPQCFSGSSYRKVDTALLRYMIWRVT